MANLMCFESFIKGNKFPNIVEKIKTYLRDISANKKSIGRSEEYDHYLTDNVWNKAKKQLFKDEPSNIEDVIEFMQDYPLSDESVWNHAELLKEFDEESVEDIKEYEIAERAAPHGMQSMNLKDVLTPEGWKKFERLRDYNFEYAIEDNGLVSALEDVEEDGNLQIYRSVVHAFDKDYNLIETKDYDGLGVYWSFSEKGAEPHHGYSSSSMSKEVTYYARVNLKHVDWVQTLVCSSWHCKEELEIRLKDDALVEVYALLIDGELHQIEPIIVYA